MGGNVEASIWPVHKLVFTINCTFQQLVKLDLTAVGHN